MSEHKNYENIPADEWDYDDGDLLEKLSVYYDMAIEDLADGPKDEDAKEVIDKVETYLNDREIEHNKENMKDVLMEHAKPLVKDELAEVLKTVNLWFEWDEADQCFYEEVTCL